MLSPKNKSVFRREGYLRLPAAIPAPLRERAIREIHCLLAENNQSSGGARGTFEGNQWIKPHGAPALRDLYLKSPLSALAESLLGKGKVQTPAEAFIYLRFPQRDVPARGPQFHVDGIHSATARPSEEAVRPMTLKFCVFLSDVPRPDCGNFTVSPGSHLIVAEHFRGQDPEGVRRGLPPLTFAPPVQLTGRAGDAVLCHGLLFHEGERNLSPDIRYAVFFNIERADHERNWRSSLSEPWLEWPGLDRTGR